MYIIRDNDDKRILEIIQDSISLSMYILWSCFFIPNCRERNRPEGLPIVHNLLDPNWDVIYKHNNFDVNVKLSDLDETKIRKIKNDIDLKIKPYFQENV